MKPAAGGGQRQQRGGGGERAGQAGLRAGRQDGLPPHHAAHPLHAPVTGTCTLFHNAGCSVVDPEPPGSENICLSGSGSVII